jgi:Protein of unknown function (DUF2914)
MSDTKSSKYILNVRNFYARFERPISSLSLIGGFVFDAITLHRVDMPWENFWVFVHLLVIGFCIVFINRRELNVGDEKNPAKIHFWLVNIMQFFFGGVLSTYVIFYFRSGSLYTSWPFILMLLLVFWANEALKKAYVRLSFQMVLFYLSVFLFCIYLTPVLLHSIGPKIFIISGVVSLALMSLFLFVLHYFANKKVWKNKITLFASVGGVFVIMNVLYFNNLIPPIPLSVKDSGVYHQMLRNPNGDYVVQSEQSTWINFFKIYDDFHVLPTETVYVYNAIFSPPLLNTTIIHDYQYYDEVTQKWILKGRVYLPLFGGRADGFRTYSTKDGLIPGKWKVDVETENGQMLGTIRFRVVGEKYTGVIKTETK